MAGENDDKEIKSIPGLPPEEEAAAAGDDVQSSAAETAQLTSGRSADDLEKEAREREHGRSERFKDHFEWIAIGGLYAMALGVAAFAIAWAYHILTPPCWHWLGGEQLAKIQNIVTGGILAGLIADQFRRRLR